MSIHHPTGEPASTDQWQLFADAARSHRREPSVLRIVATWICMILTIVCSTFGAASILGGLTFITSGDVLPVLALFTGGAAFITMLYAALGD